MNSLAHTLKSIDYDALPLSDYSRSYILQLLPNIDYYMAIYHRCLRRVLDAAAKRPDELTLVDYGGGHGFLSLTAKRCGVGKVVYVDLNPQAAEAVRAVSQAVGEGPDVVLTGDSVTLRSWCKENNVVPDILIGMDVIEHIYRLEDFFADIYAVSPRVKMLFTTGSTPYNPWVRRRLRRIMESDESQFFHMRWAFIQEHFPDMPEQERVSWAFCTRGLNYEDILRCMDGDRHLPWMDAYNTCDPATGSWTERIVPISVYRGMLSPYGARLRVHKGFYNANRPGLKGFASDLLNALLHLPLTHWLAPFIILQTDTKSKI